MPRTYVDNSYNRSVGRVGMTVGSMPISRGSSGSGAGCSSYGGSGSTSSGCSSSGSSSSSKTYVDNSYNRSLGRVGMEHGTMVMSRSSGHSSQDSPLSHSRDSTSSGYSSSTSSPKTYVDNTYNRSLGRVGMEHGTMIMSRGSIENTPSASSSRPYDVASSGYSSSSRCSSSGQFVDNVYNRSLGRVGMEKGSMVVPERSSGKMLREESLLHDLEPNVYKDNFLNRCLGRVGKPLESASVSSRGRKTGVYVDNYFNRQLGRVGKPLGSAPVSKGSRMAEMSRHAFKRVVDLQNVTSSLALSDDANVGDPGESKVTLKNEGKETRTVHGQMRKRKQRHTGVSNDSSFMEKNFEVQVAHGESVDEVMTVSAEDLLKNVVDHFVQVSICGKVAETGRYLSETEDYRLRKPKLKINCKREGTYGEPMTVEVSFENNMPETLTACDLAVEFPGQGEPQIIKQPNVGAKTTFVGSFDITPRKLGVRELIVAFNSKQMMGVTGEKDITIT